MDKPIIYLASVASSCHKMLETLRCDNTADLIALVQSVVGSGYLVEGDAVLTTLLGTPYRWFSRICLALIFPPNFSTPMPFQCPPEAPAGGCWPSGLV